MALLELAQKFGVQDDRGTILILQVTHEDLADLVGASRQKVTEHMKELERQQMILRDGRKLIVLPERLQEVVGLSQEG
jgi:CRP-like cAMP-binding protein